MIVYISTQNKSPKSTKILTFSESEKYDCLIKDYNSILTPTITLNKYIASASYAYIPEFKRYYFITNIVIETNNTFAYALAVDVLATYKTDILSSTQYIKRSQSAGTMSLYDDMLTHEENSYYYGRDTFTINGYTNSGCFVLSTISGDPAQSTRGGNTLYAISAATLNDLVTELFNTDFYGDGVVDDSVKTYFNPFQYITSCRWFPYAYSSFSGTETSIKFGWWTSSYNGKVISTMGARLTASFTVPMHENDDYFYNHAPQWARYSMYVPGFGTFEIDPLYSGESIFLEIFVDWATGNAYMQAHKGTSTDMVIFDASGQLGVDLMLTQLSSDSTNIASNIFNDINTLLGGGMSTSSGGEGKGYKSGFLGLDWQNIGQTLVNAVAGVWDSTLGKVFGSAKEMMQPNVSTTMPSGNAFTLMIIPYGIISYKIYTPYNQDSITNTYGLPCEKQEILSSLSGFTICQNVNISISCTHDETATIKSFLEGGFIIE